MKSSCKIMAMVLVTATVFMPRILTAQAGRENLEILSRWVQYSDTENMLIHHLNKLAFGYLDLRDQKVAGTKTREDWLQRQREIKETLLKLVGPFPPRTPLNPRVLDVVQKEGYRIEKIIFESMPGFYVTGCLFVPDGTGGRRPTILNAIGHSPQAFRRDVYQVLIHNLVKKGFVVFAMDPLGQGERLQYYDPEKKETVMGPGNPTVEHSYCGDQCFISGSSLARYWTWDCIRALDYLVTRSEVDTSRIGMTGCSGGGTQTAYASALDPRVKAAAPSCYLTSARMLLEFMGPQDNEHNFYRGIIDGVTSAELHVLRAPLPTLLVTTTRDYYSIQGARETYREVKRAYRALGAEDALQMAEDDSEHGFTRKNNEAIYAFFQKTLNQPGSPLQEHLPILEEQELNVTPTGQISTYLGGETVFSINRKETLARIEALEKSRQDMDVHLEKVDKKARELSGYLTPEAGDEPVYRGRYSREGYKIERWALHGEGDCMIPLLLFIPDGGGKFPALIYLHPEGKSVESSPGGQIEQLVRRGFVVAAADLVGTGETACGRSRRSKETASYTAVLIGRSIVGLQAGDAVRVADFLKARNDVDWSRSGAVAFGELCPALLHAAAFDKSIERVVLAGAPVSYSSIATTRFYKFNFFCAVAWGLTAYDLPDLIGRVAPRKLLMVETMDGAMQPVSQAVLDREMEFPRSVYRSRNAESNLKIMGSVSPENADRLLEWWLN